MIFTREQLETEDTPILPDSVDYVAFSQKEAEDFIGERYAVAITVNTGEGQNLGYLIINPDETEEIIAVIHY